jgi:hypothetical protein
MHEIMKLPPTFTHEKLLVNNGIVLIDIRKPFAEKMFWTCDTPIIKKDGVYHAMFASEDWNFSRMARKAGATKIFATREVTLTHEGRYRFRNDTEWGSLKTDA